MDLSLLQQHTVNIYNLKGKKPQLCRVKARSLLNIMRFDLFAKLYYISNINSNRDRALKVYVAHIMAFNPDGHEPGRDDKNGVSDFVIAFDAIIDHFKDHSFDERISVIPVDKDGIILDGSHRVAALAYFDKDVTIAQYNDVESKCLFDFNYFKDRGLSWDVCDIIASEMVKWCDNLLVACLWPRLGNATVKNSAVLQIASNHRIAFIKKAPVRLDSITRFIRDIYKEQPWTSNSVAINDKALRVYGKKNRVVWFVFFENTLSLDEVVEEKEIWRELYGFAKDSLHVTDNINETRQIAYLTLSQEGLKTWYHYPNGTLSQAMYERWHYFKKITLVNAKSKLWHVLHFYR